MNLVQVALRDGRVRLGEQELAVPDAVRDARPGLAAYDGKEVVVGIRPEDVEDAAFARNGGGRLTVEVDIREDMGSEVFAHFAVAAKPVQTREVMEEEDVSEAVRERARRGVPFIARLERGTQAREGERLELAVDTSRLHFFDPESGVAIY